MTTVVVHKGKQPYNIYIGRSRSTPMHWGNPFSHNPQYGIECADRKAAVGCYRSWLLGNAFHHVQPERRQWILDHLPELRNKVLGCFCAPLACHGDVLVELLNE